MIPRFTNLLSTFVGYLVRISWPASLARLSVRIFASLTGANIAEAELELAEYPTIGQFFTRRLKQGARPVAPVNLVSPVDGVLRQAAPISDGKIVQVKGRSYDVSDLLASQQQAHAFDKGHFYNFYLAPHNYHHIHSPIDCRVVGMSHIPGSLFPVNDLSLSLVERLFCRNERVVVYLESELGNVAVVLVGALNVGSISVAFDNLRTNIAGQQGQNKIYSSAIRLNKSDLLGSFAMGSSVVLLIDSKFASNVHLIEQHIGSKVQLGESLVRTTH